MSATQRFKDMGDGTFVPEMTLPQRTKDVLGRLKVSLHQNRFEADFEYGLQPSRWESYTSGAGASITHLPGLGGSRLRVTNAGDVAIRQSRPYHRYQPGKSMYVASAINFGAVNSNQFQRFGIFDDANGVFFEQGNPTVANPYGIYVVIRSDSAANANIVGANTLTVLASAPTETRIGLDKMNGAKILGGNLIWTRIQMLWIEYAWYGAGGIRFGVMIDGEPNILHQIGTGNSAFTGSDQLGPWSRTGNLPVRYEQRNLVGYTSGANDMIHFGVSVVVEGGIDAQRGFTYSYGMARTLPRRNIGANVSQFPVLSVQGKTMGKVEYDQTGGAVTSGTTTTITVAGTPFPITFGGLIGRAIFFPGLSGGSGLTARIVSNTANTITFQDTILGTGSVLSAAPAAGQAYQIGLINRGQLLPQTLFISSDQVCLVELILGTVNSPVVLTGAVFQALATLGSPNSLAQRDVSATAYVSGGEIIFAFTSPAGGSGLQQIDLQNIFALYNNIAGNQPDILTVAISTGTAASNNVGAHIVCQEAMS